MKRIKGTLHENQYTFLFISHSILLRMRNVSDKSCRENQLTHFVFSNFFFFRKSCCLWDVEKCGTARKTTDNNMAPAHCILDTYTNTLSICNIYSFSTATMVRWTRLSVTFIYKLPVRTTLCYLLCYLFHFHVSISYPRIYMAAADEATERVKALPLLIKEKKVSVESQRPFSFIFLSEHPLGKQKL